MPQDWLPDDQAPADNTTYAPQGAVNPSDPWADFNRRIQEGYNTYLGRQASDDELRLHHGNNPNGWADETFLQGALYNIRKSPEAEAWAKSQEKPPIVTTPAPPNNGDNTGTNTGTNTGGVPSIPAGGFGATNTVSSTLPSNIAGLFGQRPEATPIQSAYQDALLNVLGRSQQTPSLDDPTLKPQVEVFRAQEQRNQERQRRAAAERAAASGTNQSGYLDDTIMRGIQDQGFNTARFNAGLLGNEMDKRRQELQAGLQLASATGNAEAARELQERLAQVSASMQQQGLSLQDRLGRGDLGLRLMQSLMGNNQFYDQLGINTAMGQEGLNQRALQIILGGM